MPDEALDFCKKILKKVSRSFALTIPLLDDRLYRPVMVTYLQDRLLDNFEDEVEGISLSRRKELMNRIEEIFNPNSYPEEALAEVEANSDLLTDKWLRQLTAGVSLVWEVYDQLDQPVKEFSHHWLVEMNRGMQKYLEAEVETFADLDEYCYYVAGTVGGFLTDLLIEKSGVQSSQRKQLYDNFNDAGLFLQKVNLIRDIKRDIVERDKNFWPLHDLDITVEELEDKRYQDKALQALNQMLVDVKRHVPGLVNYLDAVPGQFNGYIKFFCVNNALGLATLQKIEDNPDVFYGSKKVKVPKFEFLKIMGRPEKSFRRLARELEV